LTVKNTGATSRCALFGKNHDKEGVRARVLVHVLLAQTAPAVRPCSATNVNVGDSLNIRAEPNPKEEMLAKIPHNGSGVVPLDIDTEGKHEPWKKAR